MKKRLQRLVQIALMLFVFGMMLPNLKAQPIAQFKICNDTLLDSKNFQFDVYIRNKPGTTYATFNLTGYNTSFKDSLQIIANGGTLSGSWVAGSSGLGIGQQPYSAPILFGTQPTPWRVYQGGIASTSSYTSVDTNWKRIYTLRITNTVDFLPKRMNNTFYGSSTPYSFKALYYNGATYSNVATIDTSTYKPFVTTSNPYLNTPITKYNVSGTSGTPGTETVTLDGSQLGCAYKLQLNGVTIPTLNEITGTGNPITWTGLSNGIYTVVGRRIATYEKDSLMTGTALLSSTTDPPGAANQITGSTNVCLGQTQVTYQTTHIDNADLYIWNYTGTGATISNINDTTINISYSSNATSGNLTVHGHNALGDGTSYVLPVTVVLIPDAAGIITGNTVANPGTTQTYIVPAINNASSYTWNYTGQGATYSPTTSTDTLVMTFAASGVTGGYLTVKGNSLCGSGTISQSIVLSVAADSTGTSSYIVGTIINRGSDGLLKYWDGSAWIAIAPGLPGQSLQFINNLPVWVNNPNGIKISSISIVSGTNAKSLSYVLNNGGANITASGVCWSTSHNPTLSSSFTNDSIFSGSFTSNITGLLPTTNYYVRAYASNVAGTSYSSEYSFTTISDSTVVIDIDGNVYHTITIGTQTWLMPNLSVTHYNNGDAIPNVTDAYTWGHLTTGAYCNYNNNINYALTYGRLYNYYTVADSRNLCPTGWHVPSGVEWTTLSNYLGSAPGPLKETGTSHWAYNTDGTNTTGFTALPGGLRNTFNNFVYSGQEGMWWSSTVYSSGLSWCYSVTNSSLWIMYGYEVMRQGVSVRCIKN